MAWKRQGSRSKWRTKASHALWDTIDDIEKEMDHTEVVTDNRTVWVNSPLCIGRICPTSAEIIGQDSRPLDTLPVSPHQPEEAWKWFCRRMLEEHSVRVPDVMVPLWVRDLETFFCKTCMDKFQSMREWTVVCPTCERSDRIYSLEDGSHA